MGVLVTSKYIKIDLFQSKWSGTGHKANFILCMIDLFTQEKPLILSFSPMLFQQDQVLCGLVVSKSGI